MAALALPDLVDKLAKGFGMSQIERTTGRAPVPVSARDQRALPLLGEIRHEIILLRAARSIDFKRV